MVRIISAMRVQKKKAVEQEVTQKTGGHQCCDRGGSMGGTEFERLRNKIKKSHAYDRAGAEAQYKMEAVTQMQRKDSS
jgi:hypothetical protein